MSDDIEAKIEKERAVYPPWTYNQESTNALPQAIPIISNQSALEKDLLSDPSNKEDANNPPNFSSKVSLWCKDYCGFMSPDPAIKRRSRLICCGSNFLFLAIILPITFLVIIPRIIQDFVAASSIDIVSISISNLQDATFHSTVTQKFSQGPPPGITASIKFSSLTITWNGAGGGDMVSLTGMDSIAISSV